MKKVLLYGIGLILAFSSCKKDTNEETGTTGLTAIETNSDKVEFVYDNQYRIIKCNYSARLQSGWSKVYSIANVLYVQDRLVSIETKNIVPGSTNQFQTAALTTFTYNSNKQISQWNMKFPGSATELTATFEYDNQNRLVASNRIIVDMEVPVKQFKYNNQGNLIRENYDGIRNGARETGKYEYIYDTKKNFLAENRLGQFLFVAYLVPEGLKEKLEFLLSANNPVSIKEEREMDYTGNPAPFNFKWTESTTYTNEYNADGYLKSLSFFKQDVFIDGDGPHPDAYPVKDKVVLVYGKRTIASQPD